VLPLIARICVTAIGIINGGGGIVEYRGLWFGESNDVTNRVVNNGEAVIGGGGECIGKTRCARWRWTNRHQHSTLLDIA